jgi:SPP1 family predicted phage head-tail adaptor
MKMLPQPGDLNRQIAIERKTLTGDGQGGHVSTWGALRTAWAAIAPLSGQESLLAQQVGAHLTHRITLRYYPGLLASDRIAYGTRHFNIREVRNIDEKNQWHELMAEEFVL